MQAPLTALARAGKKRQFIEALAAAIDGYDWRLGEGAYNCVSTHEETVDNQSA